MGREFPVILPSDLQSGFCMGVATLFYGLE